MAQCQARDSNSVIRLSLEFENAKPIEGAVESIMKLKAMNYNFSILTSRDAELRDKTLRWLARWFPADVFDKVYFAEDLANSMNENGDKTTWTWPTKADLCRKLNASLLIDDSIENALACVHSSGSNDTPVLLFGAYDWGKRESTTNAPDDRLSFEEKQIQQKINGWRLDWWEEDSVSLPDGIWRVDNWGEVISWFEGIGKEVLGKVDSGASHPSLRGRIN